MHLTEGWLREWADVQADFAEIERRLSIGGFEIESHGHVGPQIAGVVVGAIIAVNPHPEAERLQVCTVDVGDGVMRTIVCGAPNARPNLRAPVALPGVRIGEREIAVASLRGVRSEGMLCSAGELGATGEAGLWELPADAPLGLALSDYIGNERFLEVAVTPNRGDCLSVRGLGREVAALCGGRLRPEKRKRRVRTAGEAPEIRVTATDGCHHYRLCVVEMPAGPHAPPFWLQERLRHQNQKSIGTIVDITNYVMFDIGQPLHAFDAAEVEGVVEVRWARDGETITLLDGSERSLQARDLVIADRRGALALAGVMGGMRAAVTARTQRILLESATFEPTVISRTARRFGLTTDAAMRFERGVDPELPESALLLAASLLEEAGAAHVSPPRIWQLDDYAGVEEPIGLRFGRIPALLGVTIPPVEIKRLLKSLGMKVTPMKGGFKVLAPSFRFDVKAEVDLIEELARLWGYDEIPDAELPAEPTAAPARTRLSRVKTLLVDRGYQEVMTFSLVDAEDQEALGLPAGICIRNPLAAPWGTLRVSLVPGLLRVAQYNRNRQQERLRLFELGRCYEAAAAGPSETLRLGGLVLGPRWPENWANTRDPVDFFDLKGDLEAVSGVLGLRLGVIARPQPFLQDGQSAALMAGDRTIGLAGALHPRVRARLGFDEPVYVFEMTPVLGPGAPHAQEPPRFPAIRRDMALVVADRVVAGDVLKTAQEMAGPLLRELVLFDVYQGEGLDFGTKSLGLGLTLQDFSRTLTDEVVDALMARVLGALETAYGARLRQR